MAEHKIGTREEWQVARDELAKLEGEHAERNEELKRRRRELPWVAVEKEYVFDTEDGKKTLAELFQAARSSSPTTSCSGPTTRTAPVPAVRASRTGSTGR